MKGAMLRNGYEVLTSHVVEEDEIGHRGGVLNNLFASHMRGEIANDSQGGTADYLQILCWNGSTLPEVICMDEAEAINLAKFIMREFAEK